MYKKLFIFKIYFSIFFLPENVMKIKYKELLMPLSTKAIIRSFCTHKIIFFLLQKFLNIDFIDETSIQWSKTEWCIGSMNGIFSSFSEIIFFLFDWKFQKCEWWEKCEWMIESFLDFTRKLCFFFVSLSTLIMVYWNLFC